MQRHQDSLIQPDPAIHRSHCPMQQAFQIRELALSDAKVFQLFFRVRSFMRKSLWIMQILMPLPSQH